MLSTDGHRLAYVEHSPHTANSESVLAQWDWFAPPCDSLQTLPTQPTICLRQAHCSGTTPTLCYPQVVHSTALSSIGLCRACTYQSVMATSAGLLQYLLNKSWGFVAQHRQSWPQCDLRFLWEATGLALAPNLNLHWPDAIYLLYLGNSQGPSPTKLVYHLEALSAVESYGQPAGSLRTWGCPGPFAKLPRPSMGANQPWFTVWSLTFTARSSSGSNYPWITL